MSGTCSVTLCNSTGCAGSLDRVPVPQPASRKTALASANEVPIRLIIRSLPASAHHTPRVRCQVQNTTMNANANQVMVTVSRVRLPRT